MAVLKIILLPLSLIYGFVVGIRNFFFNTGILKSQSFGIPIICVGNITVGGTGKTPHTEWLLSELSKEFRVACLSRGYKRRSKGFIRVTAQSTADEVGDEPLQIKSKFPEIEVACDTDRVRGIERLLALPLPPEVIVLDDAFQHRYVKADKNVVLVDYNHPCYKDCLLPAGRLRETSGALKRADYIIVSKCPDNLTPLEKRLWSKHLRVKPYQRLFFTMMQYGAPRNMETGLPAFLPNGKTSILCITGIARPEPYIRYLKQFTSHVTALKYSDHHRFSKRDIRNIQTVFEEIYNPDKYIFTTEKDAARLRCCRLPQEIREKIHYIPIEPVFMKSTQKASIQEIFIQELKNYVTKNKR